MKNGSLKLQIVHFDIVKDFHAQSTTSSQKKSQRVRFCERRRLILLIGGLQPKNLLLRLTIKHLMRG
jgi:hypothetical protein